MADSTSIMTPKSAYLDIYIGDRVAHDNEEKAYSATCTILSKNAEIYGLPPSPAELSEEQRGILQDIDVNDQHPSRLYHRLIGPVHVVADTLPVDNESDPCLE
jgi:hypothetical protein